MTILDTLRKESRKPLGFQNYVLQDIVAVLDKGYGLDDDPDALLEKYDDVADIPAKPEPLEGICYMAVRKHEDSNEEFLDHHSAEWPKDEVQRKAEQPFRAPVVRIAKVQYTEAE